MPRFLLQPRVRCPYCSKLSRTWTGAGNHALWEHSVRPHGNAVACVALLVLCALAAMLAEIFF